MGKTTRQEHLWSPTVMGSLLPQPPSQAAVTMEMGVQRSLRGGLLSRSYLLKILWVIPLLSPLKLGRMHKLHILGSLLCLETWILVMVFVGNLALHPQQRLLTLELVVLKIQHHQHLQPTRKRGTVSTSGDLCETIHACTYVYITYICYLNIWYIIYWSIDYISCVIGKCAVRMRRYCASKKASAEIVKLWGSKEGRG